jgi:undecaprenyl-diphosphatase
LWIVLAVALTVASTDMISTRVLKNNVKRLRPCTEAANLTFDVRTLPNVNCSKYGFVSSHAANSFGYLGVHYPLDLLGGAIVGAICAFFWFSIFKKYWNREVE